MNRSDDTVSRNPATGDVIGRWPRTSPDDVRAAIAHASTAQTGWEQTPVRQRARAILRVRDWVVAHADELAVTISRENGKPRIEALATEVLPAAMAAAYYARRAAGWLKTRRVPASSWLMLNKASRMRRVPWGVVGIISPWNYPFAIPFSEVVMALLAGNAVILKVASPSQSVGQALAECFGAAGLPQGLFAHVNLPGPEAGALLLECGVGKLFFTGSVAAGRQLMAQAAQTLTPVCLELGGNDPMLVCPDADLDRAAGGALWAGMQNAGQSCGGVERIYVHQQVYQPFLERLAGRVRALRVGSDVNGPVDMGPLTTPGQVQTVRRHVDDALQRGAAIFAQSACAPGDQFLPAMVLTGVDHSMLVMREETFGPVVGVMQVADMDEAVRLANDSDLGLTASVWSRNRREARGLAARLQAGVVTINDHLMSHGLPETPWGGFKRSGIGRTHGALGFAEMTQAQCIVDDLMPGVKRDLWWHPYSPDVYAGLKGLLDMLYAPALGARLRGAARLASLFPRMFRRP